MSNFDLMYSTYDFKPNGGSQTATNFFENEITQGLPFFQENKLKTTLRNNYFKDSNTNAINYFNNGNINNKFKTSNEKIDMSDIEAKKIIEREMNPYLSLMKKELNLIVEQFNENINEKNDLINQISSLQSEIESLKSQNDIVKNNLEQKLLKNKDDLNLHDKKINNMEMDIKKYNQIFSTQSNQIDQIPTIINDISQLKDKYNLLEKNNENILPEFNNIVDTMTSMKFNNCFSDIRNLKEKNEELENKIEELNNTIKLMKFENEKKNEENAFQIKNNDDIKKLINQLKIELNNKNDKIQNLENAYENINKKIDSQDKDIAEAFSNINTEHSSIITIANNMKYCNQKVDFLENKINDSVYKKEFMDIKFNSIEEEINSQNEKIKQNKILLEDIISEKNNKLSLDLLKKNEEIKKIFENDFDAIDGNITSLNNDISELKTKFKTHPLLNMNNNEIITQKFKENQNKFNEIFKNNIQELTNQVLKLMQNSKVIDLNTQNINLCKNNFQKIEEKFNGFNQISKNNQDNLENLKLIIENQYNDYLKDKDENNQIINNKMNELNNKISCLEGQLSINAGMQNQGNNNNNIDSEQFNEIKKNIKNLENEINNIKDKKIPEILNIIDNKIQNQKIMQIPNNNNYNNNDNQNDNYNINNNQN